MVWQEVGLKPGDLTLSYSVMSQRRSVRDDNFTNATCLETYGIGNGVGNGRAGVSPTLNHEVNPRGPERLRRAFVCLQSHVFFSHLQTRAASTPPSYLFFFLVLGRLDFTLALFLA